MHIANSRGDVEDRVRRKSFVYTGDSIFTGKRWGLHRESVDGKKDRASQSEAKVDNAFNLEKPGGLSWHLYLDILLVEEVHKVYTTRDSAQRHMKELVLEGWKAELWCQVDTEK